MDTRIYLCFSGFVFLLGACLGSFLNVCIHRIPREESIVKPRSHCPRCNTTIAWYDNLPLLSFFLLRAKCRHCGGAISPRYVVIEALTATLFLLMWLKLPLMSGHTVLALTPVFDPLIVPVYWLVVFGLMLGTFVDLDYMIIPDRVSLGGIAMGITFSCLVPTLHGQSNGYMGFIWSLVGAAVGVGILWFIAVLGKLIFKKDAMGMGDVKLMGAVGAFLGWPAVLFTLMVSSFLGATVGISLVLGGRKEMQSRIPYGPYIALAALLWLFWGPGLWTAYLNWLIPPVGR